MGFLQGKRALITGIASQRSIASGIAEAMRRKALELALTYQNDRLKTRIEKAAAEFGSDIVLPLDVADDAQIAACFEQLGQHCCDGFDILVHGIAYAPREAIAGGFLDSLTRENFALAHDISAYSLAALAKAARPAMPGTQRRGADPQLPRRRARAAELQRDGRGEGQPRSDGALPRAATSAPTTFASMRSPPGRSAPSPPRGSADGPQPSSGTVEAELAAGPQRHHRGRRNVAAYLCSDLAAGVTGEITTSMPATTSWA